MLHYPYAPCQSELTPPFPLMQHRVLAEVQTKKKDSPIRGPSPWTNGYIILTFELYQLANLSGLSARAIRRCNSPTCSCTISRPTYCCLHRPLFLLPTTILAAQMCTTARTNINAPVSGPHHWPTHSPSSIALASSELAQLGLVMQVSILVYRSPSFMHQCRFIAGF